MRKRIVLAIWLLLGGLGVGCGDAGGGNGGEVVNLGSLGCRQTIEFLQTCGLFGPGMYGFCYADETVIRSCYGGCTTTMTCEEFDPPGEYIECLSICKTGVHFCPDEEEVSTSQVCDGIPNCDDASDEAGCKPSDEFICHSRPSRRIPGSAVCDGVADCSDASDEDCAMEILPGMAVGLRPADSATHAAGGAKPSVSFFPGQR